MSVDLDRAGVDVVQPRDEVGRRGLARARRPDEGHQLARLRLEVDALERERRERSRSPAPRPGAPSAQRRLGERLDAPPPSTGAAAQRGLDLLRRSAMLVTLARARHAPAPTGRPRSGSGTTRRGSGPARGPVAASRATASGASTISGSISRYSKIRSNRASAPWISTCTLSSWPSGKNSRLWSVVNATMSPIGRRVRDRRWMASVAGQPVHERRHDAEDRADDHEEPAADHRLADLEARQVRC